MAIGRTNTGGGGAGLNFKIIGGTVQPSSPVENTIWVKTDRQIISWCFHGEMVPDASEGAVLITTGPGSICHFNALKKPGTWLSVYPVSVFQYISGAWITTEAFIYQGGTWVQFSYLTVYLYNNGETAYAWQGSGKDSETELVMTVSYWLFGGGCGSYGYMYTAEPIAIPQGMTKMSILYYCKTSTKASASPTHALVLRTECDNSNYCNDTGVVASVSIPHTTEETVVSLDIPESLWGQTLYVGTYYNSHGNYHDDNEYHIKEMWFEGGGGSASTANVATFALNRNTSAAVQTEIDGTTYGIENATVNEGPTETTYDFTVL